jgi:galactose mutarotase-like enzyme
MALRRRIVAAAAIATTFAWIAGCKKETPPVAETPQSSQPAQSAPEIGGQPVVKLTRAATNNGQQPEFRSITVLPGRGMNVFQITADMPGKGEIPVLASPSLEEAGRKLNGGTGDEFGNASFSFGGAFLVPYPNRIIGKLSEDNKTITTEWHGKKIVLPANWHNSEHPAADLHAMHGLILASHTDDVQTVPIPDGQTLTGVIHAGDFGGHWLSQTDLSFVISLTGKSVDATIVAKNVGKEEEPMAIGWHPYFAIPSGDRKQALLHVPGSQLAVVNNYGAVFPTGKLIPVKGTKWDGAVTVSLADPASNYGVKILGLSPHIKTVQVYAPPTKSFAAIEEQFNFADPFGKEWHGMDTGMVTLKPGDSVEWHVRLELFQPNSDSSSK